MKYVDSPKGALENGEVRIVADGGGLEREFPALYEYLTAARYEDGHVRETSTLLLFCEEGLWKFCLNDRENQRSAWSSGDTPREALKALEANLAGDTVEWRRGPRKPGRRS